MNVAQAPNWFALAILLQGIESNLDAVTQSSYWKPLLPDAIRILDSEFKVCNSSIPLDPSLREPITDFVHKIEKLKTSEPLTGIERDQFLEAARKAYASVSDVLR